MITLTLGECVAAAEALTRLASEKAPPKVAYRIAKLLRLARVEAGHFHEQRNAAIKDLSGGADTVPTDQMSAFLARLTEIAAVPVELSGEPLTTADLDTLASVTADEVLHLGPCLHE